MEHTIAPHSSSPQEAAAEFDARFEHLTPMQQDAEQSIEPSPDLQSRLTAITAEHASIVEKWASTDERHAALVQELQARVAEWRATERRLQLGEARLGAVEEELRRGLSALPQEIREMVAGLRRGVVADSPATSAPHAGWPRMPVVLVGAIMLLALAGYTWALNARWASGVQAAATRADAAERQVREMRALLERHVGSSGAAGRVGAPAAAGKQTEMLAAILAAADLRRLDLVDAGGRQRAGQVLLSRSTGVSFSAARLAPPPAGSAYQLWLLTPEGAARIGTLPVASNGRMLATFAPPTTLPRPIVGALVTIEPAAGSDTPSGPMYLRTVASSPTVPPTQ